MLDHAIIQRVYAPGVQRRVQKLNADRHGGIHNGDHQNVHTNIKRGHAKRADGNHTGTENHGAAHAEVVEQAPCYQAAHRANDSTWHHEQARGSSAVAHNLLHIERQHNLGADKRCLQQRDQNNGGTELWRLQHANAQNGVFQLELTTAENA